MTTMTISTSRVDFVRQAISCLLAASIGICAFAPSLHAQTVSLPGQIEAESYDAGGEGVAYHDVDAANQGGSYRPVEDVDLEATSDVSGGFDVGWLEAGEWMNYTVVAAASQSYTFSARVASNGVGGQFHVEVDGIPVTGSLTVPNTGGWQTWTTITSNAFNLTAGKHVIKLVMDSNGPTGSVGNINWFALN